MSIIKKGRFNGNVVTTIIRSIVKEELVVSEKRLETRLETKLIQHIDRRFELLAEKLIAHMNHLFTKFRDETITKLDAAIAKLQKTDEEQTLHNGQHEALRSCFKRL